MRSLLGLALVAACGVMSCQQPVPTPPFQIYMKVDSDKGRPLPTATISLGDKMIGTTDHEGRALLTIPGAEGMVVNVNVKCPDGFQSPTGSTPVRLTRLIEKGKVPEFHVECPPTVRKVIVAVRADNGAHLPVKYLGNPVTKTDEAGAAHFALAVPPRGTIQVSLDTSGTELKPPSPSIVFAVEEKDEVFVFNQRFELPKPKAAAPPPKVQIAKRLGKSDGF